MCIQPELFSKSLIFLQVSDLSKIETGKYFLVYVNLIGYSKEGPCRKFTLSFFKDKKFIFSFANECVKENKTAKKKLRNFYYFFPLQ